MASEKQAILSDETPTKTFFSDNIPSPRIVEDDSFSSKQDEVIVSLNQDIELLEIMLHQERQVYQEELILLQSKYSKIKALQNQIDSIHNESEKLESQLLHNWPHLDTKHYTLQIQQRKLLCDLRSIYPIQQHLPDNVYMIGGIPLPSDIHSLVSSDEMISTALGYICHLVFMTCKYLNIPHRYRLICNSSRSVIQDDNSDIFPLFKDSIVDRDQIDRGILLLDSNITFLYMKLGVPIMQSGVPIVVKIDTLLSRLCNVKTLTATGSGEIDRMFVIGC